MTVPHAIEYDRSVFSGESTGPWNSHLPTPAARRHGHFHPHPVRWHDLARTHPGENDMKLLTALTAFALVAAPALAADKCRDAKGKFIKCPTAAGSAAKLIKDAKGKCHFASGPKKGQFT